MMKMMFGFDWTVACSSEATVSEIEKTRDKGVFINLTGD
tara:strand:- start:294 stop:410 length:117 start_codon:yes stop_codon:yes gene_type:complete